MKTTLKSLTYRFTNVHVATVLYRDLTLLRAWVLWAVSQGRDVFIDDDTFLDPWTSFAVGTNEDRKRSDDHQTNHQNTRQVYDGIT